MTGIGTIVNVVAIIVAGTLGLILKNLLSERLANAIKQGVALAVLVVGLSGTIAATFIINEGALSYRYTLIVIISLAIGALIGELIDIEGRLNRGTIKLEQKFSKPGKEVTFSQGFVTASLLFCIGSMAILGAIEDGIHSDPSILFAKSTLDAITAMIFASVMGIGVIFSAVSVGLYQGAITLLAIFVEPYLTEEIISQTSAVGSILIIAMGLNMLGITKMKVGNFLPAIFLPIIYYALQNLFNLITGAA